MSKKVAFISTRMPCAKVDGSTAYINSIFKYLVKKNIDIYYICPISTLNYPKPIYSLPKNIDKKINFRVRSNFLFKNKLINMNLKDFAKYPIRVCKSLMNKIDISTNNADFSYFDYINRIVEEKDVYQFLQNQINDIKPDIIMINYAWFSPILDKLNVNSKTKTSILTHDILYKRYIAFRNNNISSSEFNITMDEEKNLLKKVDILIAIQNEEKLALKKMVPNAKVICLPKAIEFAKLPVALKSKKIRKCLYIGSKASNNIHGLAWFLENVWNKVLADIPDATLDVCGSVSNYFLKHNISYKNVTFSGYVDDISTRFNSSAFFVIPLLAGSGLKIKLIDCFKYLTKCISTEIGVQGIDTPEKYGVIVANGADAFANHMIRLYKTKEFSLTKKNIANIKKDFSADNCYGCLLKEIKNEI